MCAVDNPVLNSWDSSRTDRRGGANEQLPAFRAPFNQDHGSHRPWKRCPITLPGEKRERRPAAERADLERHESHLLFAQSGRAYVPFFIDHSDEQDVEATRT